MTAWLISSSRSRQHRSVLWRALVIVTVYGLSLSGLVSSAHAYQHGETALCVSLYDNGSAPSHTPPSDPAHEQCQCPSLCHGLFDALDLAQAPSLRLPEAHIVPFLAHAAPLIPHHFITAYQSRGPPHLAV
jgi:hypothetical protein